MTLRLGVAGAGQIGVRHVAAIRAVREAEVAWIADPSDAARDFAAREGLAHHPALEDALAADRPDGAILATPNRLHVAGGLACVAAGLPVLVEKPLADDLAGARRLVEAAEAAGVPLLVGHHRRHNPLIAAAKARIEAGDLGRVVAAHGMFWLKKPDDYFDVPWRREPGAGPILMNLSHDVDLLRHLVGEIEEVRAVARNTIRGHPVEDVAAVLLTFETGALGTVSVSDAVPSPWSWELTAAENPAYPPTGETCYWIGGTEASLSLPAAALWRHDGPEGWFSPISRTTLLREGADPLIRQIENLAAVIRGAAAPVVPGREGLRSLAVIEAVRRSVETGAAARPEA